jgi:hypothetical protein
MSQDIDPEVWNEIVSLIFKNQKIQAIKAYREATGAHLVECKSAIESLTEELRQESPDTFETETKGTGCGATVLLIVVTAALLAASSIVALAESVAAEENPVRLPEDVLPVIGSWFWHEDTFAPDGYRKHIDLFRDHSAYDLLTTSLRVPKREVTDPEVHDQVKEAVAYARECGIDIALDLDLRLARAKFRELYPDEQQEMLRLRTVDLSDSGNAALTIASDALSDHMTHGTTPYIPLAGRVVRVYSYKRGAEGIEPDTVRDITESAHVTASASEKEVTVTIACGPDTKGRQACVMAAFTLFTPDVFSPHLIQFQRDIAKQYADTALAGIAKDEWGFPPCYDGCPAKNDYWYSEHRAAAYAERTGGRDLARDCLLMTFGEEGREGERQAAINHHLEMSLLRNAEIEDDYYNLAKETFGPDAFVVTHATWMPYPGKAEFKKNGLSWWKATRDIGQTDEVVPYPARTALAKKWGSPVWYNMYYSKELGHYEENLWAHALAGGRINYHPLWPHDGAMYADLLRGGLMRGDCRVRLLNFISPSPVDCPVAVIFGHACAMNWAGPAYDDVGLLLTDALWQAGFFADLIPSSEIGDDALRVNKDGYIQYGTQPYAAVVLYHPEFERPQTAGFFANAAAGETALYRVGDWTSDFDGRPFDGNASLPEAMQSAPDAASCAAQVIERLRELGVEPHTPAMGATKVQGGFREFRTATPTRKGRLRLIDGTRIALSGEGDVAGDAMRTTFVIAGREVSIEGVGVAAVRLAADGALDALAAGGLKRFTMPGLAFELAEPVDVAVWRDGDGRRRGVLQDWQGPVPEPLAALTDNWLRLDVPEPATEEDTL